MHNEKEFIQYLKKSKGNVRLFCDIETCTVNKNVGRKYPSKYHSFSFSLAISFFSILIFQAFLFVIHLKKCMN